MLEKIRRLFIQWFEMMNPPVFFGAAGFVIVFILYGGIWTETAGRIFDQTLHFISTYFGWYYVLVTFVFLLFVVWLYFSPYGRIRLGPPDSTPEFSNLAWFSMLFSAGMGMGLVFWGVAEPVMHYVKPPIADPASYQSFREAMRFSFFHWGFHPWAIYIIFGLGIAYFHFRHRLPLAPRSLLYPLIGERIHGLIGHLTDIFCTVGTLLGVATSLGLGAMQINSGITTLTGIPFNTDNQLLIILTITLIATASTISGVGKGIKYLSILNFYLMLLLLLFVMLAGPTLFQVKTFFSTFGSYLQNIIGTGLWVDTRPDNTWQSDWTIFYWGWWISWCPFVGIFIARISKGRTIREFIFYVFLLPPLMTFLWFSVFGGTALHLERFTDVSLAPVVQDNVSMSLHAMLGHLPLAPVSRWTSLLLIVIFFITSSDSGSLVDDMVTSGGHPNPPPLQRAFWGLSEGAAAAVLLVAGGLNALQSASISGGLIQSFLVVLCGVSLVRALRKDAGKKKPPLEVADK